MAVLLAALSLPPLSALAGWGFVRLAAVAPARTASDAAPGASGLISRAEPESTETAKLLLSFGVRRADAPYAEPSPERPETTSTWAAPPAAAGPDDEARAAVSPRTAGASSRVRSRGAERNRASTARRQERRRCGWRRLEARVAKNSAAPARQDASDAKRAEPIGAATASCQAEAGSGRSRIRL